MAVQIIHLQALCAEAYHCLLLFIYFSIVYYLLLLFIVCYCLEAQRLLLLGGAASFASLRSLNIQAAEDDAQQQRLPPPSAEDLGWIDYSVHDEEEGMANALNLKNKILTQTSRVSLTCPHYTLRSQLTVTISSCLIKSDLFHCKSSTHPRQATGRFVNTIPTTPCFISKSQSLDTNSLLSSTPWESVAPLLPCL